MWYCQAFIKLFRTRSSLKGKPKAYTLLHATFNAVKARKWKQTCYKDVAEFCMNKGCSRFNWEKLYLPEVTWHAKKKEENIAKRRKRSSQTVTFRATVSDICCAGSRTQETSNYGALVGVCNCLFFRILFHFIPAHVAPCRLGAAVISTARNTCFASRPEK